MNDSNPNSSSNHMQVSLLLPWYINGRLAAHEATQVRQHLGVCPSCANEVKHQQQLAKALMKDSVAEIDANEAFRKLHLHITKGNIPLPEVPRHSRWFIQLNDRYLSYFSTAWRFRLAMTMSLLILLSIGLVSLVNTHDDAQNNYRTLAHSNTQLLDKATWLNLVFNEDVTEEQISTTLRSIDADLIKLAKANRIYTIEFTNINKRDAALILLRENALVRLVEPAFIEHTETRTLR